MMYRDVALVLEGGGTRNSYTAPFVQQLLRDDIHFGWVGGISAGATHTVNFLSRDVDRASESFLDFVAGRRSGGLRPMLRGRGYFDAEYIYEVAGLPDGDLPLDFDTFINTDSQFCIGAVRADTGESVYWGNGDIHSLAELGVITRASSTLPGMMRMPYIDGVPYVDGAIGDSGGIVIHKAEEAGFKKFVIVLTRPRGLRRTAPSSPQLLRQVFRRTPAVAELMISRHERYNAALDHIEKLEREGKAFVFYADEMSVSNRERRLAKLQHNFALGEAQTQRVWPQLREFLAD